MKSNSIAKNKLEIITNETKKKVLEDKKNIQIKDFLKFKNYSKNCFSLTQSIVKKQNEGVNPIICEFKRKSPSKGDINQKADLFEITKKYEKSGACGISVLTSAAFDGNIMDIEIIRNEINIPILRKEFIVDEFQIHQAKAIGSDVILLIAASLQIDQCQKFIEIAHQIGLEVLLEIHHKNEFDYAKLNPDILGINNRNLKTFEVSINQSIELMPLIKKMKNNGEIRANIPVISESGIDSTGDIIKLNKENFDGYLIGESLMKSDDISEKLHTLVNTK